MQFAESPLTNLSALSSLEHGITVSASQVEQQMERRQVSNYYERRPWGSFEVLVDEADYKVKRLRVTPGHRLSLQSHNHRSEHWVVVSGTPTVRIGDDRSSLHPGEHVFVEVGAVHRISNPGDQEAVIIEVQRGNVLREDDIVRYEDDYARTGPKAPAT